MCPLCDHACSYWKLVTACGTARASHLFDNPATVFFSIFMALWGMDTFVLIINHTYHNETSKNQQTRIVKNFQIDAVQLEMSQLIDSAI